MRKRVTNNGLILANRDWWVNKQTELNDTFTKSNVDNVSVRTDQDYVKALMNLFAKRN